MSSTSGFTITQRTPFLALEATHPLFCLEF
jgi:hypothetical protein